MRSCRHELKEGFEVGKARKMNSRNRQRLADPVTFAATDAAQKEARDRFGGRLTAIAAEIKAMLARRKPRDLAGADAVRFMALNPQFEGVAMEQKYFAEADLAARLNPGDSGELIDA
jgi:hypothetical protein